MLNNQKSIEVTDLLNHLNPPLRLEIEKLRETILDSGLDLVETVKSNKPNYLFNNDERILFEIQDFEHIQIIFHCGARIQRQIPHHLIDDEFNLLTWIENDRALLSFKSMEEIETKVEDIKILVYRWINATV